MKKNLVLGLILVNVIAFFYGIYYYWGQLQRTPFYLWLFVIDCPLYAILFALVLALMLLGLKNNLLTFITSVGAFKYGVWTMFVILFYGELFLSPVNFPTYSLLFIAHFGLTLEGLFLMGEVSGEKGFLKKLVLVSVAWFLLNDFLDYGVGVYPAAVPSRGVKFAFLIGFTVSMTFVSTAIFYLGARKKWNPFNWFK
ncbi:DUF1405 domain-containing protein [Candidatus Micrarchaeota archaeon]|nr:DUF1405 domain-containing protein [Candidatus Micrarchaeota archaeon]